MALKRPSLQFYPADWRKDISVQSLNYEQKGIWFEILCLMHESEERGKLILNGKPMPIQALARVLGLPEEKTKVEIRTLIERGVAKVCKSEDNEDIIYNKRMVEDDLKYRNFIEECSKSGKKSWKVRENKGIMTKKGWQKSDEGIDEGISEGMNEGRANSSSSSSSSYIKKKYNKEKDNGKTLFLEFVKLTEAEHEKLLSLLGKDLTDNYIQRLNDYIGSKGVKYKSHYHTIRNWYNKDPNNFITTTNHAEAKFLNIKKKDDNHG